MSEQPDTQSSPLFDVEILRRHFDADWLKSIITDVMAQHEAGEKTHFYDQLPAPEALGTDEALKAAIPHLSSNQQLRDKVLSVLNELREADQLKPIVHGAGRDISAVVAWNRFVENGTDGFRDHQIGSLLTTPLPEALNSAIFLASFRSIQSIRKRHGAGARDAVRVPLTPDMVDEVVSACVAGVYSVASGKSVLSLSTSSINCPKTDVILQWAKDRLLDPALGRWELRKGSKGNVHAFALAEQYDPPKPIRHVQMKCTSGIILMADWFRIPGFKEGVLGGLEEDYEVPSINSDAGVDLRTRDHFERLGLVRVHTTNSYPSVIRDGDLIRVGRYDDEHDYLWHEDPQNPGNDIRNPAHAAEVEQLGNVCCDLWDVTFADRDVLADILLDGARIIAENGNLDGDGNELTGLASSREEAFDLLDKYVEKHTSTCIEVPPGQTLHLYMATGRDVSRFDQHFSSADVAVRPYIEDMFILSGTELDVDPEQVDEPGWKQGGNVSCEKGGPSCEF